LGASKQLLNQLPEAMVFLQLLAGLFDGDSRVMIRVTRHPSSVGPLRLD
jgi:hypothetical protein